LKQYDTKVIVNVCGKSVSDYLEVVEKISDADIDMMEINISCPNVKEGAIAFGQKADSVYDITKQIKDKAKHPIIMKLSPNVTDIAEMARAAEAAGADALSMINTLTGMKIDIERRKFALANKPAKLLKNVAEMTEGLENRIIKGIMQEETLGDFLNFVKSKRYTMAKIKRIVFNILLDFDSNLAKNAILSLDHVKALAVNKDKKHLLGLNSNLDIITNTKMLKNNIFYEAEKRADDLFRILHDKKIPNVDTHKVHLV